MSKDIKTIVKDYLEEHGYDGLTCRQVKCGSVNGCHKDNLFPCYCQHFTNCFPAMNNEEYAESMDLSFWMEKPEKPEAPDIKYVTGKSFHDKQRGGE